MFLAGTNLLPLVFLLWRPRKCRENDIFRQNLDLSRYLMVFLVRTSFPAADTLTAGQVASQAQLEESANDLG